VADPGAGQPAGGRPTSWGGASAAPFAAGQRRQPPAAGRLDRRGGEPFDLTAVPLVAPLRPLVNLADGWPVTAVYRALGGASGPLERAAFPLSSVDRYLTRPLAVLGTWTTGSSSHRSKPSIASRPSTARVRAGRHTALRQSTRPDRVFDVTPSTAAAAGAVGRRRVLDSSPLYGAVAT
jgi:hypothetical protein